MTADKDWRAINRANWDERVGVHLKAPGYDLAPLRAGRGRLNAIEEAELGPDGSIGVDVGYMAVVPLEGRTLVYADPMLATGSTLRKVHPALVKRAGRPERIVVAGVVAYRRTLEALERELGADIIVASADDALDARGYIVPGLGDAGDLAFGVKQK